MNHEAQHTRSEIHRIGLGRPQQLSYGLVNGAARGGQLNKEDKQLLPELATIRNVNSNGNYGGSSSFRHPEERVYQSSRYVMAGGQIGNHNPSMHLINANPAISRDQYGSASFRRSTSVAAPSRVPLQRESAYREANYRDQKKLTRSKSTPSSRSHDLNNHCGAVTPNIPAAYCKLQEAAGVYTSRKLAPGENDPHKLQQPGLRRLNSSMKVEQNSRERDQHFTYRASNGAAGKPVLYKSDYGGSMNSRHGYLAKSSKVLINDINAGNPTVSREDYLLINQAKLKQQGQKSVIVNHQYLQRKSTSMNHQHQAHAGSITAQLKPAPGLNMMRDQSTGSLKSSINGNQSQRLSRLNDTNGRSITTERSQSLPRQTRIMQDVLNIKTARLRIDYQQITAKKDSQRSASEPRSGMEKRGRASILTNNVDANPQRLERSMSLRCVINHANKKPVQAKSQINQHQERRIGVSNDANEVIHLRHAITRESWESSRESLDARRVSASEKRENSTITSGNLLHARQGNMRPENLKRGSSFGQSKSQRASLYKQEQIDTQNDAFLMSSPTCKQEATSAKPNERTQEVDNLNQSSSKTKKSRLPPSKDSDIAVLNDFLSQQRGKVSENLPNSRFHIILSNSASSSMISSICYSWMLQNTLSKMDGWNHVPIMNINRSNMWNDKDLAFLFQQARLDVQALIYIDEVDLEALSKGGQLHISMIGQDIIQKHDKVASYCTIVAQTLFKEVHPSSQAKCIKVLLFAGILIDTENLDSTKSFCTRRDEVAADCLLPNVGEKGRGVLYAELKQNHETQDFHDMMSQNYGSAHDTMGS